MAEPTHIPDDLPADLMDVKPDEDMLFGGWHTIMGLDGKPVQIHIGISNAKGVKCPRCWKIHPVRCNFDNLCDRCVDAILTDHPTHESVPFIKAALEEQRRRWAPVVWWQDEADVWEGVRGCRTKWIGRFNLKDVRAAIESGKLKWTTQQYVSPFAFLDWIYGKGENHSYWVSLPFWVCWTCHLAMAITCTQLGPRVWNEKESP